MVHLREIHPVDVGLIDNILLFILMYINPCVSSIAKLFASHSIQKVRNSYVKFYLNENIKSISGDWLTNDANNNNAHNDNRQFMIA